MASFVGDAFFDSLDLTVRFNQASAGVTGLRANPPTASLANPDRAMKLPQERLMKSSNFLVCVRDVPHKFKPPLLHLHWILKRFF